MSQEIEAWIIKHPNFWGGMVYYRKEDAEKAAQEVGGTVVRLTGKMPRELRKVSTEVWITPCDVHPKDGNVWARLGVWNISTDKKNDRVRCLITLEELPEEGE